MDPRGAQQVGAPSVVLLELRSGSISMESVLLDQERLWAMPCDDGAILTVATAHRRHLNGCIEGGMR